MENEPNFALHFAQAYSIRFVSLFLNRFSLRIDRHWLHTGIIYTPFGLYVISAKYIVDGRLYILHPLSALEDQSITSPPLHSSV